MEVKNSLPPLKLPLYKCIPEDLVEVEVNFTKKFWKDEILFVSLHKITNTTGKYEYTSSNTD